MALVTSIARKENVQMLVCPSPTPPLVPLVSDDDHQEDHDGVVLTRESEQDKLEGVDLAQKGKGPCKRYNVPLRKNLR